MAKSPVLIMLPSMQMYGQEKALMTLACVLRDAGLPCHFLIHAGWGVNIAQRLREIGFPYTALPMGTIFSLRLALKEPVIFWRNLSGIWRSSLALQNIIKQTGARVLIIGNATFSFYILPALLKSDICLIYRHGDEAAGHSFLHRILNRILFRRVNKHVANCHYLREWVHSEYQEIDPVVIYNLAEIDSMRCASVPTEKHAEGGPVRILYVGQLAKHKGIELLLEAFESLVQYYPAAILNLAGDIPGIGRARNERIMITLNKYMVLYPDRIIYHGRVDDPGYLFANADIHVCPSIYQEPSANVIFEAKSYGIPTVIFSVGGLPELIKHGVDGFICMDISSSSLTKGLEFFLSKKSLLSNARIAARKSYDKDYGMDRFRREWLAVLGDANETRE